LNLKGRDLGLFKVPSGSPFAREATKNLDQYSQYIRNVD